ncbi:uncharacterized protein LOC6032194 [Culex quinquefasciatus]|uniref:uncharacterized protein LOC6032194 n=1 Tax=Culex quinquefasciatus TaxID=7176 RepID=UPI0018E3A3D3|nr:uncharacterized protein LOC6032194 [Culex quinquefasciatus]
MILTGLGAEVKVIAKSFSVIFENTDQRVQWKMEGEPCSVWQTELKMKYYFWKFVQEEIGECIDLHVEFLAMLNRVRPMLNKMFYLFYYTTALSLACAAIYLATKKSISMIFIHTLIHALLIAFEFMILTRMVSWLNEAHQSIGNEVYGLDWPMRLECDDLFVVEHRSVRKIMTVVIAVSQQPLRLNGFGSEEFTQDRFWALLNLTYNFYNVLNDYNDCCVVKTAP